MVGWNKSPVGYIKDWTRRCLGICVKSSYAKQQRNEDKSTTYMRLHNVLGGSAVRSQSAGA